MQPEYPITFGKYLLIARMAVGGMAEVFRAKLIGPKGFEKKLAIKRILPEYSQDDEFVQMFVDEARISSHLHHSNIIQVFDFGEINQQYYLAMELVEGANLKNLFFRTLKQEKTLHRHLIYYVISKIASALAYAHHVKVEGEEHYLQLVHRDVSPQNILISRRGEIKITDFGIAKAAIKLTQTQPGKIQGKYSYMSPEQALGRSIDHRSDIFSLGIIFFELLTGKKVYGETDSVDRYKQATKAQIPKLQSILPDIPDEIDAIVMKMLSKDPKDRPLDCTEIINTLVPFLQNHQEDDLMRELGELTQSLFPAPVPTPSTQSFDDKDQDSTQAKENIAWRGHQLESSPVLQTPAPAGTTKTEKTARVFWFSHWYKKYTWLLWGLFLLCAGVMAALQMHPDLLHFFHSQTQEPMDVQKRPSIRDTTTSKPDTPSLVELEMELIDIESEIDRVESELLPSQTSIKKPQKPKPPAQKRPVAATTGCPKGMKWIRGGSFTTGSSPSDPLRQELLERDLKTISIGGFCIDLYEYPNQKGASPQTNVSLKEAAKLCAAKGKKLCTDLQWERACKGPNSTANNQQFPYGPTFVQGLCNTTLHQREGDLELTSPKSGAFSNCVSVEGVYDLSGSVHEWTQSTGFLNNALVITKGGSYQTSVYTSRCSSSKEIRPDTRESDLGFRCCK